MSLQLGGQNRLGLLVGGNFSVVKTHGNCYSGCAPINQNRSLLSGYQVGIKANHRLSKKTSLDTDIIYNRRGYATPTYGAEVFMRMDYLSFPLTVNTQFLDGPIDFLFGLEPSFLLSAKNHIDGAKNNARSQWTRLDVGANFGLAYRFTPALGIKFNYYLGIPSVYSNTPRNLTGFVDGIALRMRSFQCTVFCYLVS